MKKALLALVVVTLLSGQAWAALTTKYWDKNGTTAGSGGPTPTGTWDAVTSEWNTDPLGGGVGALSAWTNAADDAVFAAGIDGSGTYTVTVSGTQTANSLYAEEGIVSLTGGTVSVTGGSIKADAGASLSFAGASTVLAGASGITKTGAGTLLLGGNTHTYSTASGAQLTISSGVVDFTADLALGSVPATARASAVTINGGTLKFSGTAVTLAVNRGITIGANGGTIDVSSTASTGLTLPSAAAFTLNGAGTLTKAGAGRLTLNTTSNSFTGKYILTGGSISWGGDGRFGLLPSTAVADYFTLDGGGLRGAVTTPLPLGANRGITLGANGGSLIQPGGGTNLMSYNGVIAGTWGGALQIASNDGVGSFTGGIIQLGGVNTYNGATNIAASTTLQLGASGVIPDTSVVTTQGSSAFFTLNGFNETVKSISGTAGTFALGTNTLTLDNPAGETFSSTITGAASSKLVKNGSGAITLSGSSTAYSGETVLNNGKIIIGGTGALGSGSGVQLTLNGGTLTAAANRSMNAALATNLAGDFTVDDSAGASNITFNGTNTIKAAAPAITVSGTGQTLTFATAIGQDVAGRGIIKKGTGILALTASNTYTGNTEIDAGQININSTSTLGDGTGQLILAGGRLNTTAGRGVSTNPLPNPINLTADSEITTTSTSSGVDLNLSSNASSGTAGKKLTFRNDAASGTGEFDPRFSGSSLNLAPDIAIVNGTFGTTKLQSFNATGSQTFSGEISGTGSYNRSVGSGIGGETVFSHATGNTYSGGTTVNASTLTVTNTSGSGTGSGDVTVNAAAGSTFNVGNGGAGGSVSGNIVNNGTVNFNRSDDSSYGSATKSISGPGVVNKKGAGTLSLPNANSHSGGTTQYDGGLNLGDKASLGTGTYTIGDATTSTTLKVSSSADLTGANAITNAVTVANDFSVASGSSDLELSGTMALGAVNRTIIVDSGNKTILSGIISDTGGTGGITKAGSGVLTLTGANTYGTAGVTSTTVTQGKLLVNNTTGSGTGPGDVSVTGGTLGGTGSIAGNVIVNGGSLSPGASINVLNIGGSLSLTGGSFDYEINRDVAPSVGADLNNVTVNLALASVALSASDLGVGAVPLALGTKFTLINYGGTWNTGIFTGLPNYSTTLLIGLNRFAIQYDDTTGGSNFGGGSVGTGSHFVTITAVPEASTFLTIGLGGIFAVAAVWMSKRMGLDVLKI